MPCGSLCWPVITAEHRSSRLYFYHPNFLEFCVGAAAKQKPFSELKAVEKLLNSKGHYCRRATLRKRVDDCMEESVFGQVRVSLVVQLPALRLLKQIQLTLLINILHSIGALRNTHGHSNCK
jgi:hypothetical protein